MTNANELIFIGLRGKHLIVLGLKIRFPSLRRGFDSLHPLQRFLAPMALLQSNSGRIWHPRVDAHEWVPISFTTEVVTITAPPSAISGASFCTVKYGPFALIASTSS